MTVFSCEASSCMEPNTFNHEVWIAYSDDGAICPFPEEVSFEGSVPISFEETTYSMHLEAEVRSNVTTLIPMNGKTL